MSALGLSALSSLSVYSMDREPQSSSPGVASPSASPVVGFSRCHSLASLQLDACFPKAGRARPRRQRSLLTQALLSPTSSPSLAGLCDNSDDTASVCSSVDGADLRLAMLRAQLRPLNLADANGTGPLAIPDTT